ncbi:MAG: septum formation family protein [Herbiconiux sp.]|nr:septum formation family protein [Herbiconiux sp.]
MFKNLAKAAPLISSLLLLAGCAALGPGDSGSPTVAMPSMPAIPVTPTAPSVPPTTEPVQADVFTLEVGDCLNESESMFVDDVPKVDCSTPHDLEVFDEFESVGASFDPVALGEEADAGCTGRFEAFVGVPWETSTLDVVSYKPTGQSWFIGDRHITCMVEDTAGQTAGTLRGAAR